VNLSLTARLLLASSAVLTGFLGVTGLVLDNAFRDSAETALRDRLQGHVYALLAASDQDARGVLQLPAELPDPRFSQIDSGLYAEVLDARGQSLWRGRSLLGVTLPPTPRPAVGERRFERVTSDRGAPLFSLSFTVSWESGAHGAPRYTYRVSENLASFNAQMNRFRRSLWGWLGAAALLLLGVQGVILRWSLAPLRRAAEDVRAIEAGLAERLHGEYPRELRALTDNLNGLLDSAGAHLQRYRDSLGNLAHSLKTPLAVLRAAVDGERDAVALRALAREQLETMTRLIEHQLQRAATVGRRALAAPVAVRPIAEQIVAALSKVYADRKLNIEVDADPQAEFSGDSGDLTEMLGNLLDNACKWGRARVRLRAVRQAAGALELIIDDDGPGIPEAQRRAVLERGVRTDSAVPGHGLGLDMVRETVRLHQGELHLETGEWGGLRVVLRFAPHPA
jgi:two-component system sensor histidine kinase PhoQ